MNVQMSSKINTFVLMRKCKYPRRANEERQNLQRYRSQDLAKAILPSLDNLERALAVEGLTDDVKKRIGNGARKLDSRFERRRNRRNHS